MQRKRFHGGGFPIKKSGSMPWLANTWIPRNKSIANLGYRTPSWQSLRGRVAPKLACVQDIRPHVPELGCTSAVQNEKMYFSFVLLVQPFWHVHLCLEHKQAQGDASPRRINQARCLDFANTWIPRIKVLPTWGIRPQVGNAIYEDASPQVSLRSRH